MLRRRPCHARPFPGVGLRWLPLLGPPSTVSLHVCHLYLVQSHAFLQPQHPCTTLCRSTKKTSSVSLTTHTRTLLQRTLVTAS